MTDTIYNLLIVNIYGFIEIIYNLHNTIFYEYDTNILVFVTYFSIILYNKIHKIEKFIVSELSTITSELDKLDALYNPDNQNNPDKSYNKNNKINELTWYVHLLQNKSDELKNELDELKNALISHKKTIRLSKKDITENKNNIKDNIKSINNINVINEKTLSYMKTVNEKFDQIKIN